MQLMGLLLDDKTPAVGGAADLPPSTPPCLLLACGPAGLVESNSALVAADHQDIGGVNVADIDGLCLLDEGNSRVSGVLLEANWLAAADIVPPWMGCKVNKEALEIPPEQTICCKIVWLRISLDVGVCSARNG